MLLEWFDHVAEKTRAAARKSRILTVLAGDSEQPRDRASVNVQTDKAFRVNQRMKRAEETSVLRRLAENLFRAGMDGSLGGYGVFWLSFGSISVALYLFGGSNDLTSFRFLVPLIVILASIPLLASTKSLSHALRNGLLTSQFFFCYCGLPKDRFGWTEEGKERRAANFLGGILAGGLSYFFHPAWISAGVLILSLLFLFFSVPELSLMLILTVLPFLDRIGHASLCLTGLTVLMILALAGKVMTGRRQITVCKTDRLVGAFVLLTLFSTVAATGGREGTREGLLAAFLTLSGWFCGRVILTTETWRKRAAVQLSLSGGITSAMGIWQYATGKADWDWLDLSRFSDTGGRVSAGLGNPNVLAVFLLLSFPLALSGCFAEKKTASRLFFGGVLFAELVCLIVTWSRGAWLGAITAIFLFFLLFSVRSLRMLLLLPLPLIAAAPFLPNNLRNRFLSIGDLRETSSRYRLQLWRGVLRLLRDHPYGIGTGRASFSAVYPYYAVSGTETAVHTHSLFLRVLTESGAAGAFLLGWIMLSVLRVLIVSVRKTDDRSHRAWCVGSFCALAGIAVMGVFDDVWYHNGMLFLFFVIASFFLSCTEEMEGST